MSNRVFLHEEQCEELACQILGLDYDEIDADTEIIEEHLMNQFDIDLNQFTFLVSYLLPLVEVAESPLTGVMFKGFSNQKGLWLLKMAKEQ